MPRKRNEIRLTEEESTFAADNHNLIYDYLHKNNLSLQDFYGEAAIGFLRAVANYNRIQRLRQYPFSVIAWKCMSCNTCNQKNRDARWNEHMVLYLDQSTETETRLIEFVEDDRDLILKSELDEDVRRFAAKLLPRLTAEQQEQLALAFEGYERSEIMKLQGKTSHQYRTDRKYIQLAAMHMRSSI